MQILQCDFFKAHTCSALMALQAVLALYSVDKSKQARKSSEDAQAGYAQFEKVWAG